MKARWVVLAFLMSNLAGGFVGSQTAWAEISISVSQVTYPGDPGLMYWRFGLSADAPILGIGHISLDGVHQVSCAGNNCIFADDPQYSWQYYGWNSYYEAADTHLLIGRDWVSTITGSWLTETNDGSDPADISSSEPYIAAGAGMLGPAENGMMWFRPEYQSASFDFLQSVLYDWGDIGILRMTVATATETQQIWLLPYTLEKSLKGSEESKRVGSLYIDRMGGAW